MKLDETITSKIVSDKILTDFLLPDPDPWDNTFLKGYVDKNNKVKGTYGELFVEKLMLSYGHTVTKSINRGHDRIINSIRTEIKFGVAHRNNKNKGTVNKGSYSFNHFGLKKDWDRAILVGVDPDAIYAVWFYKSDLSTHIASEDILFNRQQGGKKGDNDDWMFLTDYNRWQQFMKLSWVKGLDTW